MKRILSIIAITLVVTYIHAQKEISDVMDVPLTSPPQQEIQADTAFFLHDFGAWQFSYYPVRYGLGYCQWGLPWGLHKGLNISIDANVSFFFGKNAPKGAAFGQNITALYVKPIDDHWTVIAGAYFNNTYFSHDNYHDGGIYGEVSYKFNDHWETSIYGQKSFMNNDASRWMPRSLFEAEHMGDRIGASVRYNFSPSFSIQVSAEYQKLPDRHLIVSSPQQKSGTSKDF